MIEIDTIYTTLDDIYGSDNVLDILIEFERVFDQLDIYVFKNWSKGEVVEGPKVDRYWITVTLMYPYKLMPDPEGARRLIDHGCKVWFGKDILKHVAKIQGPESYERDRDGSLEPKIIKSPVWLVKVTMPRHFVDEIQTDKIQAGNVDIDMDDVTSAYDENLNDDEVAKGNSNEENDSNQETDNEQNK
jgi:hypothetical protein